MIWNHSMSLKHIFYLKGLSVEIFVYQAFQRCINSFDIFIFHNLNNYFLLKWVVFSHNCDIHVSSLECILAADTETKSCRSPNVCISDEDSDLVKFCSQDELQQALNMVNDGVLRIYISADSTAEEAAGMMATKLCIFISREEMIKRDKMT